MIYDCCVPQKKCRSILKHVLKRCDNRKLCRRPVVSLSHATKSYRVNRPLERLSIALRETANAKRWAAACHKSMKIMLFLLVSLPC